MARHLKANFADYVLYAFDFFYGKKREIPNGYCLGNLFKTCNTMRDVRRL